MCFYNKLQRRWRTATTCRQAREMMPQLDSTIADFVLASSRAHASRLMQWLTGHARIGRHIFIMTVSDSIRCRFCKEEDESTIHLLECPRLRLLWNEAFNRPDIDDRGMWIKRLNWMISQPPLRNILDYNQN